MISTVQIISIIVVSVSFLAFLFYILQYAVKQKEMRDRALGGLSSRNGTGMLDSNEYRYRYYAGSNNSPSGFRVEIDAASEGSFKVAREGRFDRLAKRLGITTEIQTGDRDFDEDFFITTSDNEFAQSFFSSSDKRRAIRDIFEKGFNRIEHDGQTMVAICSPFKMDERIDESLLRQLASDLVTLAQRMPHISQAPLWSGPSSTWKTRRILAFSMAILVSILGAAAVFIGLSRYRPFDLLSVFLDSLKWSLPACVVYVALAVSLLKGRSTSHRELVIVVPIALTGLILGGWGGEMVCNGYLDTSEVTTHRARVVLKTESRSKNGTTYRAHVASWRNTGSEKIRVTHAEYRAIRKNQTVLALDTKPGRLGFEWLKEYRLDRGETGGPHSEIASRIADSTQ